VLGSDTYITDDLKINISSGEVAKLVDVLDLYTGQRLMVYFHSGMIWQASVDDGTDKLLRWLHLC